MANAIIVLSNRHISIGSIMLRFIPKLKEMYDSGDLQSNSAPPSGENGGDEDA